MNKFIAGILFGSSAANLIETAIFHHNAPTANVQYISFTVAALFALIAYRES